MRRHQVDSEFVANNSHRGGTVREERSESLVEYSVFPSANSESGSFSSERNGTNPNSPISIPSIFPAINTDSENDGSSESNETSPRFSHNSNSIESLFPPANSESGSFSFIRNGTNPDSPISIPSLFPPDRSETDSSSSKHSEIIIDQILPTLNLRIFSFTELKVATKNFSPHTVLGEGGFGKVFKGWLEDKGQSMSGKTENFRPDTVLAKGGFGKVFKGWLKDKGQSMSGKTKNFRPDTVLGENRMVIAVRKLSTERVERFREWQSLVNFLGGLSHPNLIKLLGYCREDRELLLIYEFMQKGSLADHLLRRSAIQPLPWDIRLKIAIGAARGLAFLSTLEQIIFEDFKASNILLDGSYTAKILLKLGPSACESLEPELECYDAPRHLFRDSGKQNVKSDEVYGFGVVLVQILTGLRRHDKNPLSSERYLVDWIKPYLSNKRKLKQIMDSRLEGKYPLKAASHISQLALQCLAAEPKLRPSMKEVLEKLERFEAANERPREPRNHASHPVVHRHGQRPLHHSPLHPRLDGNPAYQNSSRVR